MTATALHRPAYQRSFSERAWNAVTSFFTTVGDIYNRNDAAKRSRLSWQYFAA